MAHETRDLFGLVVAAIDRWQRRRLGIWEFSADPACILRLGLTQARTQLELGDGTTASPGETIGVIHFWNERIPQIPPGGATLAWALAFGRSLAHSFHLLALHAGENPALAGVQVYGGELPLAYTPATVRLLHRLGLEGIEPIRPQGLGERALDLGARLWTWLLRRAFNPQSARGLRLGDLERRQIWLTRNTLFARHAPPSAEHSP